MRRAATRPCQALLLAALAGAASACQAGGEATYLGRPVSAARVLASFPHDPQAFTQGLEFRDGLLYESTGLYGRSRVLVRRLEATTPLLETALPAHFFGEGLTLVDGQIVQLTWRARTGIVYARDSLLEVGRFAYTTEGWGLAYDGRRLIKSDGSDTLEFLAPRGYAVIGRCRVRSDGRAVTRLNELEVIDGLLYANIWGANYVARIDPESCKVRDWIDLSAVAAPFVGQADVLNGIAWDADARRLFVTGKLWSKLFQIEVPALAR